MAMDAQIAWGTDASSAYLHHTCYAQEPSDRHAWLLEPEVCAEAFKVRFYHADEIQKHLLTKHTIE